MALGKFDFSSIAEDCVKCGKCIPVCTIHQISPDETTSPRGFLDLLGAYQNGKLSLDKEAKRIFESCFLCTNCVDVCPTRLPTDTAIEEVRAEIAKEFGITWFKRLFFWLLRHRGVMDLMARLGYVFRSCAFESRPQQDSMLPRFSLPIVKSGRLLPSVAKKSFLQSYPQLTKGRGEKPQKVAIFIGCMANYSYTGVGDALMSILSTLGIETIIPKDQLCCGAPAYFTGDFATVESLVHTNIERLSKLALEVDAILIPEATCSSMIKLDWNHVLQNDPAAAAKAKPIIDKVRLATQWLYENTPLAELLAKKGKSDLVVTYHDPCHSRKTQGVFKQPRALLSQNYEIAEMENPNRCCGFGGVTMQTERFELSQAAGAPKAAMIKETNAQIVSAECSACRMQLTNALFQNGVNVQFKNPLELIAEALK